MIVKVEKAFWVGVLGVTFKGYHTRSRGHVLNSKLSLFPVQVGLHHACSWTGSVGAVVEKKVSVLVKAGSSFGYLQMMWYCWRLQTMMSNCGGLEWSVRWLGWVCSSKKQDVRKRFRDYVISNLFVSKVSSVCWSNRWGGWTTRGTSQSSVCRSFWWASPPDGRLHSART